MRAGSCSRCICTGHRERSSHETAGRASIDRVQTVLHVDCSVWQVVRALLVTVLRNALLLAVHFQWRARVDRIRAALHVNRSVTDTVSGTLREHCYVQLSWASIVTSGCLAFPGMCACALVNRDGHYAQAARWAQASIASRQSCKCGSRTISDEQPMRRESRVEAAILHLKVE
jgi:hypothetical protein